MANHPTGSTRKNWATQKNVKPTRQRCTKPTPSSWILAFIFATWTGAVHWYTRERGSMNITVWNLKHFLRMLSCFGFFTDRWIRTQYARWGRVWSPLSISQQRNYYIFTYNFRYNQCFQTVLFIPNILKTRWRILTRLCQGATMSLGHLLLGFRAHGWRKKLGTCRQNIRIRKNSNYLEPFCPLRGWTLQKKAQTPIKTRVIKGFQVVYTANLFLTCYVGCREAPSVNCYRL